jgi:pectinesterase inhibitor-like protein
MKRRGFSLAFTLVLLTTICSLAGLAAVSVASSNPADFVRRSCKTTSYPDVCYKSLAKYAPSVKRSTRQLAYAALNVSADRARSVSSYVAHMSGRPKPNSFSETDRSTEDGVIRDCIDNLKDSVDQFRQSLKEMGRLGRANSPRFAWHLSNVQTWVSGALTDETTCLDSLSQLPDSRVKVAIRKKVVDAAQATSNALALLNQLGPHY